MIADIHGKQTKVARYFLDYFTLLVPLTITSDAIIND